MQEQAGLRFSNITIPYGARITNATLQLQVASEDDANTVQSKIRAQLTSNGQVWSTTNRPSMAPYTSAGIDWDSGPWAANSQQTSPNLASVIQEIVNQGGWLSGNVINFVLLNDGTTVNADRGFSTVEGGAPATLTITFTGSETPPPVDTTPPSPSTNLTATVLSSGQINLSWTASTDNVGVSGYRVERCQGASCTNYTQIATPAGTSFNDTGLTANTTYRYQVRAADAAGNLSNYSSSVNATTQTSLLPPSFLPAFPGAEGFGTETRGGRGGVVKVVTNLNGSGPGSFREAMLATGPRIIVFRVSGVIDLGGDINLSEGHSNVTVLGQSSPGGITFINGAITNYQTNFHDAIFRFIRIRSQAGDTLAFNPVYNLVVDHSDFSGGSDETFDIDNGHDFTVQWSTILNSMKGNGSQNYGALIAYRPTNNMTFHHNFQAHHYGRCGAQFHWAGSNPIPVTGVNLDLRNNVFYNCGTQQIYRADLPPTEGTNFNLMGNYAKSGPNTPSGSMMFGLGGRIYMNDNLYPGQSIMSIYSNPTYLSQPHPFPAITTTSALQAYDDVLNKAGSWPRDAMTTRTVTEAQNGTGTLGKLNDPLNTSTGPTPAADADLDGITDSWELTHGLSPINPLDSAQLHSSGYANIEVYLNEIAQQLTGQVPPPPSTALVGDLNGDRIVNSLDWSLMNSAWSSNSTIADLNRDGIVNSLDFSLLNANWAA